MAVFLFGRLMDEDLRATVLGGAQAGRSAFLDGFRLSGSAMSVAGPGLEPEQGEQVTGMLVLPTPEGRARLARFGAITGCRSMELPVTSDGQTLKAQLYLPEHTVPGSERNWSFSAWRAAFGLVTCLAMHELMDLTAPRSVAVLRARFPMAMKHAASRLRAAEAPSPARLRSDWQRDSIRPLQQTRPYSWFFSVAEDDLHFRRFDGSWSPEVKRAGFAMCDAVTVLPYDPVRDVVLLIEQFRFGPWLRGAQNCWSLEPVAGHIDPGETAVDAALREASEEARITLRKSDLRRVAEVYPSPGAVSEFLFQFVALCDLPKSLEGVAGLETEAENIRSHILPFDELIALIESGEVENGPLVLTAYCLATRRAQLRAEAQGR